MKNKKKTPTWIMVGIMMLFVIILKLILVDVYEAAPVTYVTMHEPDTLTYYHPVERQNLTFITYTLEILLKKKWFNDREVEKLYLATVVSDDSHWSYAVYTGWDGKTNLFTNVDGGNNFVTSEPFGNNDGYLDVLWLEQGAPYGPEEWGTVGMICPKEPDGAVFSFYQMSYEEILNRRFFEIKRFRKRVDKEIEKGRNKASPQLISQNSNPLH